MALLSQQPYGNRVFEIGSCLPSLLASMQLLMNICVPGINRYGFNKCGKSDLQLFATSEGLKGAEIERHCGTSL